MNPTKTRLVDMPRSALKAAQRRPRAPTNVQVGWRQVLDAARSILGLRPSTARAPLCVARMPGTITDLEWGGRQEPPRTARTNASPVLEPAKSMPSLKSTNQACSGWAETVVEVQ